MKWYILCLSTVLWLAAPAIPAPVPKLKDTVQEELQRLQGTWKVVSYQRNGIASDQDSVQEMAKMTIKERRFQFGDDASAGDITAIDPAAKPKTTDYKYDGGAKDAKPYLAIYELDGDTFRVCIAGVGKDRPTEFKAEADSQQTLIVYERVKGKK